MTDELLDAMTAAAIAAAEEIMAVYARPFTAATKTDGSPVTEADHAAEAAILARLEPLGVPVLAEESVAAGRIPALGARYFVVDPLDGTREFVKRNGEFTVNIALVEDGRPTRGVVLAPAFGELYVGGPAGARMAGLTDGVAAGWRGLSVSPTGPMRVVASRSHGHEALADLYVRFGIEEDVSVGSSLKFCLLARGAAELYPRFTPTSEWDTAAGQAVLEAAGGTVLALDGAPLSYGKQSGGFLNPFFVAAVDAGVAAEAARAMRELLGGVAPGEWRRS